VTCCPLSSPLKNPGSRIARDPGCLIGVETYCNKTPWGYGSPGVKQLKPKDPMSKGGVIGNAFKVCVMGVLQHLRGACLPMPHLSVLIKTMAPNKMTAAINIWKPISMVKYPRIRGHNAVALTQPLIFPAFLLLSVVHCPLFSRSASLEGIRRSR